MNTPEKKSGKRLAPALIILFAVLLMLIFIIANRTALASWVGSVLAIFRPVLIGLALAYLINPIFRFFERRLLARVRPQGLRRALSLILAYITVLLILALLLLLIVPRLIESIMTLIKNYDSYISSAIVSINNLLAGINSLAGRLTGNDTILEYLNEAEIRQSAAELFSNLDRISGLLSDYLSGVNMKPIQNFIGEAVSILTDSIFGIFVSIYLLSTKEKRYAQIMKLRHAIFSDSVNNQITKICKTANEAFGGFLEGKLLGSAIIGVLTFIALSIFRVPYPLLIATLIAVFSIIPIVGMIIAIIPTTLILLLTVPGKAIPFLLIMLVIQQIDVNIISPKVLGNNTGVSSLCILISITVMGTLWGPIGMFLGVPIFASLISLADDFLIVRLQKKGLPSGLANYYANDTEVDPTKNANLTTDKLAQGLEKKALLIKRKKKNGEALKKREKFLFAIYRLAHQYHLFAEITDETHARFSAEQAITVAEAEAEELLAERLRAKEVAAEGSPIDPSANAN